MHVAREPQKKLSRVERRAQELGITVDELKQRRQRRAERLAQRRAKEETNNQRSALSKNEQTLADLYAENYSTFDALRVAMLRGGVVEHRVSPFDVIQRAIDDCATDYLLLRQRLERKHHGNIEEMTDDPLYAVMERVREAMVRYSTFAMQYDIQLRQLKLSEARVGVLAATLRNVLNGLGLNPDQVRQVPQLLIRELQGAEGQSQRNQHLDVQKAEAIAEILHNDTEVVIELDEDDIEVQDVA